MEIALIDYGAGNLHSAYRALIAAGGGRVTVTSQPEEINRASHIFLPGVGAFGACMKRLSACDGVVEALERHVNERQRPFLGVCVGMQLMMEKGYEYGVHHGLGWVEGDSVAFDSKDRKIPHMGWNDIALNENSHPILHGMDGEEFYFVHSYYVCPKRADQILASSDYQGVFAAIIGRGTAIGTQFHPEKSHRAGIAFLKRFLTWKP